MGSGLSIPLIEVLEGEDSDPVMDDNLIVFAINVDAELLNKCRRVARLCTMPEVGENYLR